MQKQCGGEVDFNTGAIYYITGVCLNYGTDIGQRIKNRGERGMIWDSV